MRRVLAVLIVLLAGCVQSDPDGPDHGSDPGPAWSQATAAPAARTEVAVVQDGPQVYVIGGIDAQGAPSARVFVYDIDEDAWREGPLLPTPLHHAGAAVIGGDVYVLGGYAGAFQATTTAFMLRPGALAWTPVEPLPEARGAHAVGVVDGTAYLVGGIDGTGGLADSTLAFTPTDGWRTAAGLPTPREHLAATVLDGKVHAVAGRQGGFDTNLAALEAYDPVADAWEVLPPAPTPRGGVTAATWQGSVVLIGGEGNEGTFAEVEAYDPSTGTWHALPDLPTPRHGLGSAVHDGLYTFLGGPRPGFTASDVVEVLSTTPKPIFRGCRRVIRATLTLLLVLATRASAQNATPPRDLLLDRYANPLPAPLDNAYGLFLAEIVVWFLVAGLFVMVLVPVLRAVTKNTPTDLDDRLISILGMPVAIAVIAFGVTRSLRFFALPSWAFTTADHAWGLFVIVLGAYVVYRAWHEVVLDIMGRLAKRTKGELDDALLPLFDKTGGVVIIVVAIWLVLDSFGINMTLFAAGGALGGLVIAFAAQDTLANFFAGVQIMLDKPFRKGDRIEIKEDETWGDVTDIGLRTTRIRTVDNRMVVVPNALIATNPVINHSFPNTHYRLDSFVGVAYGTDLEHARKTILDAVNSVPDIDQDRPADVLFTGFGDSSLDFRARWWISNFQDARRMEDRVNTAIHAALYREDIEIPFPQRVLWRGAPDVAVP